MPVYTAADPKGNQKATPALSDRGLELVTSTMSAMMPTGFPEYRQLAYTNYINLLPAFMQATVENKIITCNKRGYPLKMPVDQLLPIPFPRLVFSFEKMLSTEQEDALKQRGCYSFKNGKNLVFGIEDYNRDFVSELLKHEPPPNKKTIPPFGSTNLLGLTSFLVACRIATAFLRTQTYPAFDRPFEAGDVHRYESMPEFVTSKRTAPFTRKETKRPALEEDEDAMEDVDQDDEVEEDIGANGYEFGHGTSPDEQIPRARPPTSAVFIFGSPGSMPSLPGMLFPYFPALLDHDFLFVPSVVRSYFLLALGPDRHSQSDAFKEFKGGCGSWAATESGKILQHVFCGIQLAIEAQCRLYLFLDKKYSGFSLHGWYFHVLIYNRKYSPVDTETLSKEAQRVDEHAVAIFGLIRLLKKLKVASGWSKDYKALPSAVKDVKGARHVHEMILSRVRSEEDDVAIDKLVSDMTFQEKYQQFTAQNIVRALERFRDDVSPPVGEPMYIGNGIARKTDMAIRIFSVFGELGPSFLIPGGKGVKIPASKEADVMLKVEKSRKTPTLNVMVVAKKPLVTCARDLQELMRTKTYVNRVERASAYKSARFSDAEAVKVLWHGLIDHIGAYVEEVDQVDFTSNDPKDLGGAAGGNGYDDELAAFFA